VKILCLFGKATLDYQVKVCLSAPHRTPRRLPDQREREMAQFYILTTLFGLLAAPYVAFLSFLVF
jgi:hypothetical protein